MSFFGAMEVEEKYLRLIAKPKEKAKFNFAERMELHGYKNIDAYHREKELFLFNVTPKKFRLSSFENIHADEQQAIEKGEEIIFIVPVTKKWVCVGSGSTINDPEASYVQIGHECDSILATPKDLDVICVSKQSGVLHLFIEWAKAQLASMGLTASKIMGVERFFVGHSIYYFQIFFDGSEREGVLSKWQPR